MSVSGNAIVSEVEKFVGDPYVYGAEGPTSFDCSGLVQYVLTKLGVPNVPRTSEAQYAWADKISASDLAPGDLVFAQFPGDNASPGHVGVYVGGGRVLSAEDPAEGVGFDTLSDWGSAIVGYGRVPNSSAGTGTSGTSASLAGSILSWPTEITGAFGHLDTILQDILSPSFWLRIASFFAGVGLLVAGVWCLMHASDDSSLVPDLSQLTIPVPV
jgi:cell wall-associated NlpC family hydrolase